MAKLNIPLGKRAYEVIRDRIGAILMIELENQAAIQYDDLFYDIPIFVQRSKPINHAEEKIINVSVDDITYQGHTQINSIGTYTFFIDVVMTSSSTDDERGDMNSAYDCQRLASVCATILDSPHYKTLDFKPPFIGRCNVTSINPGKISRGEATELNAVRITLEVMSGEDKPLEDVTELNSIYTRLFLENSKNGFLYIWKKES